MGSTFQSHVRSYEFSLKTFSRQHESRRTVYKAKSVDPYDAIRHEYSMCDTIILERFNGHDRYNNLSLHDFVSATGGEVIGCYYMILSSSTGIGPLEGVGIHLGMIRDQ